MTRTTFIFLLLHACATVGAKGIAWCYDMQGVAYDKGNKRPLVNERIVVGGDTVMTDAHGNYQASVCGITCCSTKAMSARRCNARSYDRIFVGKLNGGGSMVRSKWKKYGLRPIARNKYREPRRVWRKDLFL